MAEFYKYAKRGADSQVDWATIGSNFIKVLQDEVKFREEKKAAIEKDTNDLGNKLANAPLGESTTLNQWTLNGTDQIMKARLLQDRLLRSGQLKYKDYVALRQNLTNSSDTLFSLAKEYNAQYKEIMERSQATDPAKASQEFELFLAGTVEGFANFSDTQIALNQYDNTLSITKLGAPDKNGIRTSTGEFLRADELRNRLKTRYNKYNADTILKSQVDTLGDVEEYIVSQGDAFKTGWIKVFTDPTMRGKLSPETKSVIDRYKEWEDKTVSAQLSNQFNTSSILSDWVDIDPKTKKAYSFTDKPELAKQNSNLILFNKNRSGGTDFEFSEDQRKSAENFIRNRVRNMLDQKVSIKPYNEPSETREEKRAKIRRLEAETGQIGKTESEFNTEAQMVADLATGQFKSTSDAERAKDWVLNKPIGKDRAGKPVFISTFGYNTAPDGTLNYEYSLSNDLGDKKAGQKYQTTDVRSIVSGILEGMGSNFEQRSKIINKAENILNQYGGNFPMAGPARRNLMQSGQYIEFQPVGTTTNTTPANTNPADQFKANTKNRPPLSSYEGNK